METFTPTFNISKYNSAVLKNFYLDELWKSAVKNCTQGKYDKWNAYLDMIWGELAGDLDEKAVEFTKFNRFIMELGATGNLTPPVILGFNIKESNEKKAKQYLILLNKHLWLKKLQNRLGRGTAYKDEFEDDFE